ncbi:unnamed protein product, partial [Polarella glacialis]
ATGLLSSRPTGPVQALRQPQVAAPAPRLRFSLSGDPMELMIAPGDVIVVRGSGRIAELGAVGGFMGHVLVVVGAPQCIRRNSEAHALLNSAWPVDGVEELWRVPTVESTRRESGLYESELLLFVDRRSRQLVTVGEVDADGDLCSFESHEPVELWQSPDELRAELRVDVMWRVLAEMRGNQANWSAATAARAVLKSSSVSVKGCPQETME